VRVSAEIHNWASVIRHAQRAIRCVEPLFPMRVSSFHWISGLEIGHTFENSGVILCANRDRPGNCHAGTRDCGSS
jgi:hypothetical protein